MDVAFPLIAGVDRIRAELTGLVGFLSSERTPEPPPTGG
jgi:hypothetical protein